MAVPGIRVEVRDYNWAAEEHLHICERDFIVCYRPYPIRIGLTAQAERRAVQDFGQLNFVPAGLRLKVGAARSSERMRVISCHFEPEWMRRIWKTAPSPGKLDLAHCMNVQNLRVEQALRQIGTEVIHPRVASSILVESLSTSVAIEIARHFNDLESYPRLRTRDGQLSEADLQRIVAYIESDENRCPTNDEIARACNISAAHLRRAFKKTTGKTLGEFGDRIWLQKAQRLLAETELPMKQIAYRLGIASASTFSSTFKRMANETPSGYRYRRRVSLST
jgi:AraC family transcriptional regulator